MLSVAVGLWGGLTARAGIVAADEAELDTDQTGFGEFAARCFSTIRAWYRTVRVGVSADTVFGAVADELSGAPFSLWLNPGHLTHYDEWLHTPIVAGEERPLASGMMLQCDMIPASDSSKHFATARTRSVSPTMATRSGDGFRSWPRASTSAPRGWARNVLPRVLLTNMPAYFRPLLLRRGEALSFPE